MALNYKKMMKWPAIILLSALLFCSCSEEVSTKYAPTEKDTLSFLVAEADLIALIRTIDGAERGPKGAKDFSWREINATANQIFKGSAENGGTITIINQPFYHEKDSTFHFTKMNRDTTCLAFLKIDKESKKYKLVTGISSSAVYGNNRINPVWFRSSKADISLEDAVAKLTNMIKK